MNRLLPFVYGQFFARLVWPVLAFLTLMLRRIAAFLGSGQVVYSDFSVQEGIRSRIRFAGQGNRVALAIGMLMAGWLGAVTHVQAQGPGGVNANVRLWLRANSNFTPSQWNDQSGNNFHYTQANGPAQPAAVAASGMYNFNPAVNFQGNKFMINTGAVLPTGNSGSIYTVVNLNDVSGIQDFLGFGGYSTSQFVGSANMPVIGQTAGKVYFYDGNWPSGAFGPTAGKNGIASSRYQHAVVGSLEQGFNGLLETENINPNPYNSGNGSILGSQPETTKGAILEAIVFNTKLSAADHRRVESYLAVKYGITLPNNYLASDGTTTIYNPSTYGSNILGIGRDDATSLMQKQSRSQNDGALVTVGLGTAVVTDQSSITTTFGADKTFEMIGDNGAPASYSTSYSPLGFTPTIPGAFFRMGRTWRVTETGTVGSVLVSIPASTGAEYLLVSSNGTFGPTTQEIALTPDGNGNLTASHNFNNGDLFTFGASVQAPGCVPGNLRSWLKAGTGTNTTTNGAAVNSWNNSALGIPFSLTQPTAFYQPKYATNVLNGNPALDFSNDILSVAGGGPLLFPNDTDPATVVTVTTNRVGLGYNQIWSLGGPYDLPSMHWYYKTPNIYADFTSTLHYSHTDNNLPLNVPTIMAGVFSNANGANTVGISYNGTANQVNFSPINGTYPAGKYFTHDIFSLGAENTGVEPMEGYLAESISYNRRLSNAELQKVYSYLGIKYGITLNQDYLAGDGTTVYSVSSYSADVTGIGRDDCQALDQRRSKSVNTGSLVTISNLTSGGSAFGADESFEIIGDNGRPASYSNTYGPGSFTSAAGVFSMARIWKVEETGTVGNVVVSIPGSGSSTYLLVNGTGVFSTSVGVTEIQMQPDGAGNLTATVNFTDGQFFTFAAPELAPGCVAGTRLWLKADVGTTVSGTGVSAWSNQSPSVPFSVTQGAAGDQPVYLANGMNYNPAFDFKASQVLTSNAGPTIFTSTTQPATILAVSTNRSTLASWKTLVSFGGALDYPSFHWFGESLDLFVDGGGGDYQHPDDIDLNTPTIGYTRVSNNTAKNFNIGYNGLTQQNSWTAVGVETWPAAGLNNAGATSFSLLTIGSETTAGTEPHNGLFTEAIVYNRILSNDELMRVQSYLGIKYGITLTNDYKSGDNTTVYSVSAYSGGITGIGRDDCQALNQKQSKSVNKDGLVTIGIGTGIATTNALNTNDFVADKAFEIIGDNGQPSSYTTVYTPASFTASTTVYSMARKWRVQETGTVGTVTVQIPGSGDNTYLLVRNDATFTSGSGTTEVKMVPDGNGNLRATFDFTNGQYFTFATPILAPGCVVTGLSLWTRADVPGAAVGSQVVAWPDNSPNSKGIPAVGTLTVQAPDAAHNYHPYFTGFSATNYFFDANSPVSPNTDNSFNNATYIGTQTQSDLAIFAVVRPTSANGYGRITGSDNEGPVTNYAAEPGVSLYLGAPYFYKFSGVTFTPLYVGDTPVGQNSVLTWNAKNGTAASGANSGTLTMGQNGIEQTFGNAGEFGFNGTRMAIGNGEWNVTTPFPGDIQEIIWYRGSLSQTDRRKVQSYLALKYGTTLSHNYLSGNGTTVYDVSSYSANVTGVAREDCQGLNQKQSKSVNSTGRMAISISNTLAAGNADNLSSFTADQTFVTFGDNGQTGTSPLSSTGSCPPPPLVDRVTNLAYKFTETGSAGPIFVQENITGFGFNATLPMYMQIYSDAAFTNLLAQVPMSVSGTTGSASYDFPANATSYVRFAGNTTAPANMCVAPKQQTFHWNGWWYGTKNKVLLPNHLLQSQSATAAMTMSVSITDGGNNNLLYKPTVDWWPVFDGLGLFIPRHDNNTTSGLDAETNVITTRMQFRQGTSTSVVAAATASFVIRDVDGWIGGRDIVTVYGKVGSTTIVPQLSQYKPLPFDALQINHVTGTATGSNIPWDLGAWANVYVTFDSPVEEIYVAYRKDNTYAFNVYNDIRIGAVSITCAPPVPKAPLADNVYVYKEAMPNVQKTGELVQYKFTVQNTNCAVRTMNLNDVLPSGLSWVDSTFVTSNSLTVATNQINAYGGGNTLQLTGVSVPPGTHYFYASVTGDNVGTYNNQASYQITNGTNTPYLSDDPTVTGSTAQPTPLTLIQNDPDASIAITKLVDKTTAPQNSTLTYTYIVSNLNATSAITTNLNDVLPGSMTYVGGTLTGAGSATVNAYAGTPNLTIRGLNVPANSSLTLTITTNTSNYTVNTVANNVAILAPEVNSGFRIKPVNSAPASTTIQEPPTVVINTPPNNSTAALNSTVSGTATPGAQVVLTSSSGGTLCTTTATVGGTWNCQVTLASGAQTLSAVASNNAGTSSPATANITAVSAPLQANNPPTQTALTGGTVTGSAPGDLTPSGGSSPYSYTNATGEPSCSAVAGANPMPASNLTVNSATGSYTYVAPSSPGLYYFCIKVCDATTPTPDCVTKTYLVAVGAPQGGGTLDCSTAKIMGIVAGTAGNGVLTLGINVSLTGAMSVSVSGSGMSTNPNPYVLNATSMGAQTFYVPLTYSGAAFAANTVISVSGAGTCTVDMTAVVPRVVSRPVLELGPACTPATAATLVK
jgi:large repetitive protein